MHEHTIDAAVSKSVSFTCYKPWARTKETALRTAVGLTCSLQAARLCRKKGKDTKDRGPPLLAPTCGLTTM
jgi:hypothetical protein